MYVVNVSLSTRPPLDVRRIVRAGIDVADDEGVGGLSMRRLADRLGCGAMSLYNHVANKDALLSLMVDAVTGEVEDPPESGEPLVALRRHAVATRAMFLVHRWAPSLWLKYLPGPARVRHMELQLDLLARSELSDPIAHHGFHAVNNHVLGYTLQEMELTVGGDDPQAVIASFLASIDDGSSPRMVAHVHQHLEGEVDGSFELVLDLILDGLVRLDAGTSTGQG